MKGSIAVDGVSLTVSGLGDDWLESELIPTTLRETSLGDRRVGDELNLESDIVWAIYVARLLGAVLPQTDLRSRLCWRRTDSCKRNGRPCGVGEKQGR
jgi:riboflavin synthase alpha subunit